MGHLYHGKAVITTGWSTVITTPRWKAWRTRPGHGETTVEGVILGKVSMKNQLLARKKI